MVSLRFAQFTALALATLCGCQRLDGDDDSGSGSGNGNSESAGNIDDDGGGGTLLSDGNASEAESSGGSEAMEGCDAVLQTDCDEGEKCTAILSGGVVQYTCVTDDGMLETDATCTVSLTDGLDGCLSGLVCLGDDAGTCRPHCDTANDCEASLCLEDPIHEVRHCAAQCSPFEPLCPSTLQCRRRGDRFACVDPQEGDVGGAGTTCNLADDGGCAAGLLCVPGALAPGCENANCCVPLCDLSSADSCNAPATCNGALIAPAPGFENVGACFVPA